jgi:hypothetical protein
VAARVARVVVLVVHLRRAAQVVALLAVAARGNKLQLFSSSPFPFFFL